MDLKKPESQTTTSSTVAVGLPYPAVPLFGAGSRILPSPIQGALLFSGKQGEECQHHKEFKSLRSKSSLSPHVCPNSRLDHFL